MKKKMVLVGDEYIKVEDIRPSHNICVVCLGPIQILAFKNTMVCCENHRKKRDGEAKSAPQGVRSTK
jgi:hypothetical protein